MVKDDLNELYANYRADEYEHYRSVPTGKYDIQKVKSAKSGERLIPILKDIEVSFEEIKNIRLDSLSPAVPLADTEDFTIISNYMIDFWGAIMGDGPVSAYMHLKRHCYGKKDFCFPDLELIALKMKISINTLKKYIRTLEEYSFVIMFLRRGKKSHLKSSPLFKIRRFVPMITEEMYNQLHPRLQELHDEFMKQLDDIQFSSEVVGSKTTIESTLETGRILNNKDIAEKQEEVIQKGKLEEFMLNMMTDDERKLNESFHEYIEHKISKPSYDTWIKRTVILYKSINNKIYVLAANEFARDWLEERYLPFVREWADQELFLPYIEIQFILTSDYIKENLYRGQ